MSDALNKIVEEARALNLTEIKIDVASNGPSAIAPGMLEHLKAIIQRPRTCFRTRPHRINPV
jgi:hypothetical protein